VEIEQGMSSVVLAPRPLWRSSRREREVRSSSSSRLAGRGDGVDGKGKRSRRGKGGGVRLLGRIKEDRRDAAAGQT
jgi:hypothetical protein